MGWVKIHISDVEMGHQIVRLFLPPTGILVCGEDVLCVREGGALRSAG